MNRTVFAIGAHPDDIEFLMAGTLLLLKEMDFSIHVMHLSSGCCGTSQHDVETISRIRMGEAKEAAEILGAVYHPSIGDDLRLFYDSATLARVASIIRQVSPDILLLHSPDDYMEDHMVACRLGVTGAFGRGMRNFPVEPHHPLVEKEVTIYHAQPHLNMGQLGNLVIPEIFLDISSVIHRKKQMLMAHRSQMAWLDDSQSMESPVEVMLECARELGRMSGLFDLAEGWRRHHHAGLCKKGADPLLSVLSNFAKPVEKRGIK